MSFRAAASKVCQLWEGSHIKGSNISHCPRIVLGSLLPIKIFRHLVSNSMTISFSSRIQDCAKAFGFPLSTYAKIILTRAQAVPPKRTRGVRVGEWVDLPGRKENLNN